MSSTVPTKPQALSKPQAPTKPKGVQPKKSGVIKLASPEVIAAVKQPLPSGQLEAAPQSFAGIPPPPIDKKQEKIFVASRANPLVKPATGLLKPVPEDTGPSLPAAPIAVKKPLKHVTKKTPDYTPPTRKVHPDLQEQIDTTMAPIFKEYETKQAEIESANPYLTDTTIYTPQSRKSFYRFVGDNYTDQFKLIPQVKGKVDEDACAKLGAAAGEAVESFLYQKFVREYIRNASPYRGVLVYHGLGSGKTCSAIAAAEALFGTSNKKIIVMTPFSLRGNFMSEVSFCGFRHFSPQNHWTSESLISEGGLSYLYGRSVLSLSEWFLNKVLERPEEERKTIWIPDFTKPPNYNELTQQERDDIRAQLTNMIENRIKFISYNGITAKELKRYACQVETKSGERLFDNAVIVIDEIHNLTRLMQGEITPYITKRKGRPRKIPVEPITPGKWKPGLCGQELNYKRSYLFYKLLSDARNSKIIGLSGTPIINFPDELGILANVLSGYIECAEFSLNSVDKAIIEKVKTIAESEPRVDIVRFVARRERMEVLISVFNEGYERVMDEDDKEFVGVKYNAEAQDGIQTVFQRIKAKLIAEKVPIGPETYVSYPRLPIDDKEFKNEFINGENLTLKNKVVLQKRLTGLVSYYKGSKEEYMPRVTVDEVVKCEMSDYTLSMYTVERNREIQGEKRKKSEGGDNYAAVEQFAKMKNPSSYRFRSRALCNFSFPKGIERPFPDSLNEEEEEVEEVEDLALGEAATDVQEDLDAQEAVAEEEKSIIDPDEEGSEEEVEGEGTKEKEEDLERVKEGALEEAVATAAVTEGGDYEEDEDEDEDEDEENIEELDDEVIQEGGDGTDDESETAPATIPSVTIPPLVTEPVPVIAPVAEGTEAKPKRKRPVVAPSITAEPAPAPVVPVVPSRPLRRKPMVAPSAAIKKTEEEKAAEAKALAEALAAAETEAVVDAEQEQEVSRVLTYQERIKKAMKKLGDNKNNYLKLDAPTQEGRLSQYSSKLDQMIRRIQVSKGSNLVYSQFKTVEGLGVLGHALKANGYVEIEIEGGDWMPRALRTTSSNQLRFSAATIESLRKGPDSGEKRFMFLTGEGLREKRNLLLNIFNGAFDKVPEEMRKVLEESGYGERKNKYGEICWVFGITGAGAEGISLKCCRSVHIMEPYWNKVRLDQVKGRAIRICSHQDLPFRDREVEIYTYYTVFSAEQKSLSKIDVTITQTDKDETSDEKVYNVGVKKDLINQEILDMLKETAVDCGLNAADNGAVSCFVVDGKPDQYLFDPNLEVDKILTTIELKEVATAKAEIAAPVASATAAALGPKAAPKVEVEQVQVIKYKGIQYLLRSKKGSGGLTFEMFAMTDDQFKRPLGEISINPGTGSFKGSTPVLK
jgi:hypothetical protein